ncbi:hypothetical protein CEXT_330211 [Caerostris extrusa]|uniref:Uncharacterized protein n=1 Tax=Caerostris extrusa TaxID=172846 RepID=A0AAV4SDW2_CAEEX|nr:hypothetical protein CEXT_330211 [Caerostris extrusa]
MPCEFHSPPDRLKPHSGAQLANLSPPSASLQGSQLVSQWWFPRWGPHPEVACPPPPPHSVTMDLPLGSIMEMWENAIPLFPEMLVKVHSPPPPTGPLTNATGPLSPLAVGVDPGVEFSERWPSML